LWTVVLNICIIWCHALLCSVSLCVLRRTSVYFCHCVSSVTVVLWQKVNLTNNHLIFQIKIGVILCENNWRLKWHIIEHTAISQFLLNNEKQRVRFLLAHPVYEAVLNGHSCEKFVFHSLLLGWTDNKFFYQILSSNIQQLISV